MVSKWLLFLRILSNALDPGTSREPMVRAFFHTLIVRAWVRKCVGLLTLVKNIQTSGQFLSHCMYGKNQWTCGNNGIVPVMGQ
jgi:hypothetical protein